MPTVRVGDTVYVGQKIGEVSAPVSSPIHASVSGTVKKIENMLLSNGTYVPAVQIESDGQMTPDPHLAPPTITDKTEFLSAVRESGVVGLGSPPYFFCEAHESLLMKKAYCYPSVDKRLSERKPRFGQAFSFYEFLAEFYLVEILVLF